MVKNINKFIETDAEYLRTCFFTPNDITKQDKKEYRSYGCKPKRQDSN